MPQHFPDDSDSKHWDPLQIDKIQVPGVGPWQPSPGFHFADQFGKTAWTVEASGGLLICLSFTLNLLQLLYLSIHCWLPAEVPVSSGLERILVLPEGQESSCHHQEWPQSPPFPLVSCQAHGSLCPWLTLLSWINRRVKLLLLPC